MTILLTFYVAKINILFKIHKFSEDYFVKIPINHHTTSGKYRKGQDISTLFRNFAMYLINPIYSPFKTIEVMNKTVKVILKAVSYVITLFFSFLCMRMRKFSYICN